MVIVLHELHVFAFLDTQCTLPKRAGSQRTTDHEVHGSGGHDWGEAGDGGQLLEADLRVGLHEEGGGGGGGGGHRQYNHIFCFQYTHSKSSPTSST